MNEVQNQMKKTLLSLFLFLSLQNTVVAENVLASCGSSQGKTYFIEEGNRGYWRDDRIPNGSIKLIFDDNNNPDIIVTDKAGKYSARSEGAKILNTHIDEATNTLTILVVYPKPVIETYQFHLGPPKKYVVWTGAKALPIFSSLNAMRAECE
jgi:hypothetical protein